MLRPRINNQISALRVRVLGPQKENMGIMSREEALRLVLPGLDLIEIVPEADPPVVRLMSFDKFRYEQEKAIKKERREQKGAGLKQVQISARSADNDVKIKLRKLEEFLSEGHPVEINLRLRGREKGMKQWAEGRMREFMSMITVEYKVVSPPKFGGRGMVAHIVKK